jgi:hypothetical protein
VLLYVTLLHFCVFSLQLFNFVTSIIVIFALEPALNNININTITTINNGGTALQAGRSRVRFPMVSLKFFTMALRLTQPLTEMGTRHVSLG